jgi:GxxExxY protein
VHSQLGPGLLESCYQTCLAYELKERGLKVELEVPVKINYDGKQIKQAFRIDILVESEVVLELKSVEELSPIHEAQILTYLKLSEKRIGLLINFNETKLKYGLKRFVL